MKEKADRILFELTIFDLKNDNTGVHVYFPKNLTEQEFLSSLASLAQVTNSLATQSLKDLQADAAAVMQ